ncbi:MULTISPECIES: HNH endonuclease [unclassified Mesorhizobium]|uniref:HNH endonuclease n=3 Tax=Mesorhizobium TaxID=68287 RepID=UPI000FCA8F1D|nr:MULTISPECIES: HNH endonuclease [unclassified Mesorhizobium]TGP22318.1 HNH endonuclease [Mesorhizobium sp. M1D.F.Ca.ET.231.01.1.1]TGP24712.1 HNH endonuclease [Mesorhizobium sp. M1D.F.Ca.ET.234.01.1.1]TGS37315.1 HNH endonuclease [Mesorhizobium sp. M1D.F.Ca.ET.184.01.1.1]TGS58115.1 HNH endonuclease [Mesorhizobium sp. M1D.F.Ca.ET.183.01.1.1]
MKGRQIRYSDEELSFIEWRQAMSRRALHAAFVARFGRPDVKLEDIKALCSRRGWLTGRTGGFEKGSIPFNKGKPHPARGRAAETQFKKGSMTGAAAAKYKPIGTERFNKDGYLERKIHDGLPLQSRWRLVHLIRWEELNGALPAGEALKCLDGDRRNTDPSNWRAIPRALLARLAGRYGRGYDAAPSALKPTILAIAELEHAARERAP